MRKNQKRLLENKIWTAALAAALAVSMLTAFTAAGMGTDGPAPVQVVEAEGDFAAGRDGAEAFGSAEGAGMSVFSLGPGYQSLPYSDTYGDYQWALLNSGIFKLVPSTKMPLDNVFQGWLGNRSTGENRPGPARESDGTTLALAGIDINIIPAWKKYDAKGDKRQVAVAVIDTGIDYSHQDLAGSIWINEDEIPGDGIDNDGNGYIDDVYGWNFYSNNNQVFTGSDDDHGTHSAGTIAAARNGVGTIGICDPAYVKVMSIKALGTPSGVGTADNVAKAIRYAQDNGAVICNLSFGTNKYSEELYQTMKNSGMLFVVAAGNGDSSGNGYNIDSLPVYPASFDLDNIISVANLRFDGKIDPASNFGVKSVDLAAPGSYILSTVTGNKYSYMSGTSMAAPMVTGAAAMLYSYDPGLSLTEIKGRILNSVHRLESLSGKTATGGMLDVSAALNFSDN
ncbi:S8 family peptidase [[Clostridium] symbiosum]|nr:S8 family peptidase [[Clostridium] symbiosum]MCB6610092.1 S8 family serine peptidase [[Clostridium] symbiosum]MCB6932503.1 S8 family serine peptidase [[Clostridium] symbiosum]